MTCDIDDIKYIYKLDDKTALKPKCFLDILINIKLYA